MWNVFGFTPPSGTNLLRRALVLRSSILRKSPPLKDASGSIRVDGAVGAFSVESDTHAAN